VLPQQPTTLEHQLADGTTIRAHVEHARIVGYSAHDPAGRPIPVRRLRITDATPSGDNASPAVARIRCYYCICNPECHCWPEDCPIV
jgi:hypothetical protein